MNKDKNISKALSYWLRHKPEAGNITVDPSGWAETERVLAALEHEGLSVTGEELSSVVSGSDKNRFELTEDGAMIRARQGHSIKVDLDWPIMAPPAIVYHGTVARFLEPIMADGLRPMKRHHVHLSPDLATATKVGSRRGQPIILEVAAGRMQDAGTQFRLSGNGV